MRPPAVALAALLAALLGPAAAAQLSRTLRVPQGGLATWPGDAAVTLCGRSAPASAERHLDASWPARGGACYYPVDLEERPGALTVFRVRGGVREELELEVASLGLPTERVRLPDRFLRPTKKDLARAERERQRVSAALSARTEPRAALPFGPPLSPLPAGGNFGVRRVLNGVPKPPHAGIDFKVPAGTPVRAMEAGRVAIADFHFFAGGSVIVDHGDGLFSMSFHLSRIDVKAGQEVTKGQIVGLSGATGRVSGPHLHQGIRWHGARLDPRLLLADGAVVTVPAPG